MHLIEGSNQETDIAVRLASDTFSRDLELQDDTWMALNLLNHTRVRQSLWLEDDHLAYVTLGFRRRWELEEFQDVAWSSIRLNE